MIKSISLLVLIKALISFNVQELCISLQEFSKQQSNYNNFLASLNTNPLGSGNFGTVRELIFNSQPSVVKIQKFENFQDEKFFFALSEIKTLKMLNDDIDFNLRIKEEVMKFRVKDPEKKSILPMTIKIEAFGFLNDIKILNYEYFHLTPQDFKNKYSEKIQNLHQTFDLSNLEKGFIQNFLKKYSQKNGSNNYQRLYYFLTKTLSYQMVLKYKGCVYNAQPPELYIFLEKLSSTFQAQIPNFKKLYKESQRIRHYLYLLTDIRAFHTQYSMVHMDIKPDNIMISKNFDNSDNSRLKLIDYGLMKKTNQNLGRTFYNLIAHPSMINKRNLTVRPYMDIFAFLLSVAWVEFGEEVLYLEEKCYLDYSLECFETLKGQIIMGFCNGLGKYGEVRVCRDSKRMFYGYRPGIDTECKNLLCFIISNLHYDEKVMEDKIDRDNVWNDSDYMDRSGLPSLEDSLDSVKYFSFGGLNYNIYIDYLKENSDTNIGVLMII